MSLEIKVSSFNRQVAVAAIVFIVCAIAMLSVKMIKRYKEVESNRTEVAMESKSPEVVDRETVVERDVEVNYLEPFLRRLGFSRDDWVRQLPVRIGRGQKAYPDYALKVRGTGDDVTADYIWEAKYTIPSENQLRIDFGQAKSYALLLRAKVIGLVSKEGIWYVTADDNYDFDCIKHYSWDELESDVTLKAVKSVFAM